MATTDNIKPVEVFSGTAWQAEIIREMLLDNEIESYLGDEIWGLDTAMQSTPDNGSAVKVFVDREDYNEARIIVERYYEEDFIPYSADE